jgi:hypothetical protein
LHRGSRRRRWLLTDAQGCTRDPLDVRRLGNEAMRTTFDARDLAFTASFATHVHKAGGVGKLRQRLTRSMAYVARYLRQQMPWVEALPLNELAEWAEAAGSIVEAENGKGGGGDDGGGGAGMPGLGPAAVPD